MLPGQKVCLFQSYEQNEWMLVSNDPTNCSAFQLGTRDFDKHPINWPADIFNSNEEIF